MYTMKLQTFSYQPEVVDNPRIVEQTNAQKKRGRFSTMFTLHALMNRAGVKHENSHTLTCFGYIKTKDRF